MKSLCLTLVLSCLILYGNAQKNVPEFGSDPDTEELLQKEHPTDKFAPAEVLADAGDVSFNYHNAKDMFIMEKKIHRRIKIYNAKGLGYANVKLYYYSDDNYEQVRDISAYVYNINEKGHIETTRLSKDQVFRQPEYGEFSSVRFALPSVKPGSIIEYQYTVIKKSFTNIDPWIFQHTIPAAISRFRIKIPELFRFNANFALQPGDNLERKQEDARENFAVDASSVSMGATRFTYTLRQVKAMKAEPYMGSIKDYLSRIEFKLSGIGNRILNQNWRALTEQLQTDPYFGKQLTQKVSIPELEKELSALTSTKTKTELIHKYIRTNIEWTGQEDFKSYSILKIYEERKGSTGDINLLLLNQLKKEKIEAYPLLVSTREHGRIDTDFPSLEQFNSLYVLVKINDSWFVLNGANKYNSTYLVPAEVMNTKGLMINEFGAYQWITMEDNSMKEKNIVTYSASVGAEGSLTGNAYITSSGYAKTNKTAAQKEHNDKYLEHWYTSQITGLTATDFSSKHNDNDTLDMVEQFKFSMKLNHTGEYYYLNTNMFTGLEQNPFIAENRVSDIEFGYTRRFVITARIEISEELQPEELPKDIFMIMPDTSISITRTYEQNENVIMMRIELDFNKTHFRQWEYAAFKVFYKQLFDMLNEQVVFKRKKR